MLRAGGVMRSWRYGGAHAAPRVPTGAVRRALRLVVALALLVGVVAAGMYVARDRAAPGAADAVTAGQAGPATSNDASRPPVTPVPVGSDPGDAAPDFTVRTAGGGTFSLSSDRGRVVVLDFLAPGCLDCTAELSTFVIDPAGIVTFRDSGFTSPRTLETEIRRALA